MALMLNWISRHPYLSIILSLLVYLMPFFASVGLDTGVFGPEGDEIRALLERTIVQPNEIPPVRTDGATD